MTTASKSTAGARTQWSAGARVKFNDGVAFAFIGQTGTIISEKADPVSPGRVLYVVELDTPTAPAENWSACATLAVPAEAIEAA